MNPLSYQVALWRIRLNRLLRPLRKRQLWAAIGIFFGIAVGAGEYLDVRLSDREKKTIDFILRLEDGHLHKARTSFLREKKSAYESLGIEPGTASADMVQPKLAKLIKDDKKYEEHFFNLYNFYTTYSSCINRGICDWLTGCILLETEINQFLMVHHSYIKNWRLTEKPSNISLEMHVFSETCNNDYRYNSDKYMFSNSFKKGISGLYYETMRRFNWKPHVKTECVSALIDGQHNCERTTPS